MTSELLNGQKELLLHLLRHSYDAFAWHGPNLTQALDGVGATQASWRPATDIRAWNIYEVTLHAADVMQRCSAELLGTPIFRDVNRDAFPLPDLTTETEWKGTLEFLQQSYATLERGLRTMAATALGETSASTAYGRTWTVRDHIEGVALHNVYHAAQIVSLRKRQGAWTELA